jgi:exosortase
LVSISLSPPNNQISFGFSFFVHADSAFFPMSSLSPAAKSLNVPTHVWTMGATVAIVLLSYLPVLLRLSKIWTANQDYSHGFLVLPITAGILWFQRERWFSAKSEFSNAWPVYAGLALILIGMGIRLIGILGRALPVEGASLPVVLLGLVLVLFGAKSAWITLGPILFLLFLLPLPSHFSRLLRGELQGLASTSSVYVLQVLGAPAVSRGNVIQLPNAEVGVVEACSGLRMVSSLGAIAFLICLLAKATILNKILMLACVLPIAILVNVFRVVVTALAQEYLPRWADQVHDLAGWVMILLAFALLLACIKYLSLLFVSPASQESGAEPAR